MEQRQPRLSDPRNPEVRQLGAADPTLGTAALSVADQSGHGTAVAASGSFAAVLLGDSGDPTAHAQLLNHLQPALKRHGDLDADDQDGFRAALGKFVDIYAFLAEAGRRRSAGCRSASPGSCGPRSRW
jgi:hypothetical protein